MQKKLRIITIAFFIVMVCGFVRAESGDRTFSDWELQPWADPLQDISVSVRIQTSRDIEAVTCHYVYPNGDKSQIDGVRDPKDAGLYSITIPPVDDPGMGSLELFVEVKSGSRGAHSTVSEVQNIPMGYVEDLDITANPPEIIYFNLPPEDDRYHVRYKACCNILGASIIATRTPVNPMETADGLPDTLLSDFVVLEPDELSKSTSGLFFVFSFALDSANEADAELPVLYEFVWKHMKWVEVISYYIMDGNKIDFACDEGGAFVLGKRQK